MNYVGKVYRPPSEAHSYLLQATIGCSWNKCTYCDMYRDKPVFRPRPLAETLADVAEAGRRFGGRVDKVFVMDGDALVLPVEDWLAVLAACRRAFPALRQVSCYATADNVREKGADALATLRAAGLKLLYMGPETGDAATMKRIAKGGTPDDHVDAARLARAAGLDLSVIFLLGAGGLARSEEHARASGRLAGAMDPRWVSALTLTIVPGTPLARLAADGRFVLPDVPGLLRELRWFLEEAHPTHATFRTNHASNYLPLGGELPADRDRLLATLDAALDGRVRLRPEWSRGL